MSRISNVLEDTCSKIIYFCNKNFMRDGVCVHSPILKLGIQDNLPLTNNLLSLYAKCHGAEHARHLFDEMPHRDVVSWTGILSAHVKAGNHDEALRLFDRMKASGEKPNEFTFSNVLRSCSASRNHVRSVKVHACVIKHGYSSNPILCTGLIELYSKLGFLEEAVRVFNGMENGDTVSWTSLISSFLQAGDFVRALRFFNRMIHERIPPNEYTFVKLLTACSSLSRTDDSGRLLHSQSIIWGVQLNLVLKTSLVDMYGKCRNMGNAVKVLKQTPEQDVQLWTTLISGFTQNSNFWEAILSFNEMRFLGHCPNSHTLSTVLEACGAAKSSSETRKIHGFIVKTNADNKVIVRNALIDAYAGLLMVDCAMSLAKQTRSVVTYTVLASRLNQMGLHKPCLEIIKHMREDDVEIDGFVVSSFLSASADSGSMKTGKQLHCYSIVSGFGKHASVSNGLIDFYGKCSCVSDAQTAFGEMSEPDIVSWNSLIHGFALNEPTASSLSALEDMRLAGIKPDSHTLSAVLFACSKGNLVDMGIEYFQSLTEMYDIKPLFYHYNILVDLLGRDGRLDEAVRLVKSMTFGPRNVLVYKRLLSACRTHGNVILGEEIARKGLELDSDDFEFYVILASLYDEAGRTDLGDSIRGVMKDGGLRKTSVSDMFDNC